MIFGLAVRLVGLTGLYSQLFSITSQLTKVLQKDTVREWMKSVRRLDWSLVGFVDSPRLIRGLHIGRENCILVILRSVEVGSSSLSSSLCLSSLALPNICLSQGLYWHISSLACGYIAIPTTTKRVPPQLHLTRRLQFK